MEYDLETTGSIDLMEYGFDFGLQVLGSDYNALNDDWGYVEMNHYHVLRTIKENGKPERKKTQTEYETYECGEKFKEFSEDSNNRTKYAENLMEEFNHI